jgi:RNA polymerase primary sigma factor
MKQEEKLITDNLGYVITLARQYKSDILSTDDLVSEGCIGLMKAAKKYDPQRGKPFVTFAAPYVRQAIEQAISRVDTEQDIRSTDESLPIGSRNNYTLLNVLEDPNAPRADALIEQATLTADMVSMMGVLSEREQAVIARYFGVNTERQTMAEIGQAMGLKRERVRQIRNQAMRKLRRVNRE